MDRSNAEAYVVTPDEITAYEDGQVKLKVCIFYNPLRVSYWLVAGAAALEFTEDTWRNLENVLDQYYNASSPPKRSAWWYLILIYIFTLAVLILVVSKGGLL